MNSPMGSSIQVTLWENSNRDPLSKKYNYDGRLRGTTAAMLRHGAYHVVHFESLEQFAESILMATSDGATHAALSYGVPKPQFARSGNVVMRSQGAASGNVIHRSRSCMQWPAGCGVMMGDVDCNISLADVKARLPVWMKGVGVVAIPSSSSRIHTAEGLLVSPAEKWRLYWLVSDASQIPRIGERLLYEEWSAGRGWAHVTASGGILPACMWDGSVWAPERLDFAFGPVLEDGLWREADAQVSSGAVLDASAVAPAPADWLRGCSAWLTAKALAAPRAEETRRKWLDARGQAAVDAAGGDERARAPEIARQTHALEQGALFSDFVLYDLDGGAHTVREILSAPEAWHDRTIRDPFEPDVYVDCTKLYLIGQQHFPVAHCFAHGRGPVRLLDYTPNEVMPPTLTAEAARLAAMNDDEARLAVKETAKRLGASVVDLRAAVQKHKVEGRKAAGAVALSKTDHCANAYAFMAAVWPHVAYHLEDALVWRGGAWKPVSPSILRARVRQYMERAINVDTGQPYQPCSADVSECISAILELKTVEAPKSPCWLTDEERPHISHVIAFPNGWLDARTGAFHNCEPALFTRNALAFDYNPCAATPKRWLRFLADTWPSEAEAAEFIPALQRYMGMLLVNDTSSQTIGLLKGPSGCGKGVLLRLMTQLVGEENTASVSARALAKSDFALEAIRGKTLVTLTDMRLGPDIKQDLVERLLSISGEDLLGVNRKHKSVLHERLDARIVIATNEIPNLPDDGGALCRRYRVFQFYRSVPEGQRDPRLSDALAHELPGIFNWALEGLRMAWKDGLPQGPLARMELSSLREASAPLSRFIEERLTLDEAACTPRTDVYQAYCRWALQEGVRSPMNDVHFGRRLRDTAPQIGDRRPTINGVRVRCLTGIKLQNV